MAARSPALDAGGALTVGPRSAGAVPGPACYGRGGTEATVTDADLVAGRLPEGIALPGLGVLDAGAARAALARAGVDAAGVIAVVEAAMTQALRAVTVERGVDPRGLALVAFGGAGPLHACGLADALGMPAVLVPARAGVLSAAGILVAEDQRDLVRSWPTPGDHRGLDEAMAELGRAARQALGESGAPDDGEVEVETSVDCRYRGQSHELSVPAVAEFAAEHRRRNGYAMADATDRGHRHPGAGPPPLAAIVGRPAGAATLGWVGSDRHRGTRLHHLGARRVARRARRGRRAGADARRRSGAEPLGR